MKEVGNLCLKEIEEKEGFKTPTMVKFHSLTFISSRFPRAEGGSSPFKGRPIRMVNGTTWGSKDFGPCQIDVHGTPIFTSLGCSEIAT